MIRTLALLALLVFPSIAPAHAEERDALYNVLTEEKRDCAYFSECASDDRVRQEIIGDTPDLGNAFDNDGHGSRRALSDSVLDQLSPASGR